LAQMLPLCGCASHRPEGRAFTNSRGDNPDAASTFNEQETTQ
jgi:hypothetical protein